MTQRETMTFDVVIVGAGPAGLSAAIRLKQVRPDVSVCILEKGPEVGAHILSGAVLEPRALNELLPDWNKRGAPLETPAREDQFLFLTKKTAFRFPTPPPMRNHGNYIVSLGDVCRFLAREAEAVGVEIYPAFAATAAVIEDGRVKGVVTGDMGVGANGQPNARYQPGIELRAQFTLLAEGCRGSLSEQIIAQFNLRNPRQHQTYAIGIKELWEVPNENHRPGLVMHTIGWPLDRATYGGSFLYHFGKNLVSYGFVVGLDYQNPWLSPYEEAQRVKLHPVLRPHFRNGRRIAYGARALNEGGLQSIPQLVFPGGALIGCAAGFLNVAKIKGTHTAMKSGMVAAEILASALEHKSDDRLLCFEGAMKESWVWQELHRARNLRPGFARFGVFGGLLNAALDTYIFRGQAPWTLRHGRPDSETLHPAETTRQVEYPKPDGILTFDRLSSVYISNTHHEEDQPSHLRLRDPGRAITVNWEQYASPETRYCPAGVYEIVEDPHDGPRLVINAQNCVHCKSCDIKDENITWVPPQEGGPRYPSGM